MTRREPETAPRRIRRERKTMAAMVTLYCRAHHGTRGELCAECAEFLDYAFQRLQRCPFGGTKPTCADCTIHCYAPERRQQAKQVMRYAGPRMLFRHPVLAVLHLLDGLRKRPMQRGPMVR